MNYTRKIDVISINKSREWDEVVRSFKNYDVNYLSEYAKAFQLNGEGEPLLIYYNYGTTRAINISMKRDISQNPFFKNILSPNEWFDISTPYGYGGFWIEGNNHDDVNISFDNLCSELGIISEFIRFHLLSNYHNYYNGQVESHSNNIIRNLQQDIHEITSDFEYKVRKNIKRAEISNLAVEFDKYGSRLDEFLEIYYETMNRNEANKQFLFSKEFFKQIQKLENNFMYVHVLLDNKVISTELVLYGTENCYSFLGGTNSDYFDLRPNDFLKFEIIKWAKSNNLKNFILGGGYGEDDGIYRYKKSFAPNGIHKFHVGKKIFNNNKYNILVNLRNEANSSISSNLHYFPTYRA